MIGVTGVQNATSAPAERVIPLKHIARVNVATLDDMTDPDYAFDYIDISSVTPEVGIARRERVTFGTAPSRARRKVAHGDTIVSTVRTYLRAVAFVDEPDDLVVSTGFAVLSPGAGVDPRYLYRAVQSKPFVDEVVARSTGVSYPAINPGELGRIGVHLPDADTQRAIADFLDRETERIDALVAKKQQLIELLQEKRTALISRAVTKGLDPDVPLKDSGIEWLGPMPRHWRWAPLKRLLRAPLQYGASEAGGGQHEDGPRFIRITDIDADGHLRDGTACFIPERAAQGFLLDGGDVLFARSGATAGKTYLYDGRPEHAAFAGYLIRASVNPAQMLPKYLRLFTQTHTYLEWVGQVTIQSTIQNVNAERYASLAVPLPPAEEQATIVGFVDDQVSQIDASAVTIGRAIELLSEYRSALITAAVTGQIDVGAQKARRQAGGP